MSINEFLSDIQEVISLIREQGNEVIILHHNDADGLASAAVLKLAFSRANFSVDTIALERLHPPIVERIHSTFHATIIYSDLGGKAAPMISDINKGRELTMIIDHHPAEKAPDPRVHNLSTELYGISGEDEISAATAAFIFAQTLNMQNKDLAYLGVIGAIGDSHDRSGKLVSENRKALLQAVENKDIKVKDSNQGDEESYGLLRFGTQIPISKFATSLTILGAAGYYSGGPSLGIKTCLEGPSKKYRTKLNNLEEIKEQLFNQALEQLGEKGLNQANHIQWFNVGTDFNPMGVKMIGEFCMNIRNEQFIDSDKYIAGFQDMGRRIPGLGDFDWNLSKVSMRVPSPLEERIVAKQMPGLAFILPEAAEVVGGSIDACHNYAAASLIPKGFEEELIKEMDKLIKDSA